MSRYNPSDTLIVCYLLHFDQELRGKRHYIGSTLYTRRLVRWREHALGNGSAYTKQFIRAGIGFNVVRLWLTTDRTQERRLKDNGDMRSKCPHCTPSLTQYEPLHFIANDWAPTIDAHWSNRKSRQRYA